MLIKQATELDCEASTRTKIHHKIPFSRRPPGRVPHPRQARVLRPSHRALSAASSPFTLVQSFCSWHLRDVCHHIRPSRVRPRDIFSGTVVIHPQQRVARLPFLSETGFYLQNQRVEEISSQTIRTVDLGAHNIPERIRFHLKHLQHLPIFCPQTPFDILRLLFCRRTASVPMIRH